MGQEGGKGRKGEVYISGSFRVSNTAATGIPKFDTGPQKSLFSPFLPHSHWFSLVSQTFPMKYYIKTHITSRNTSKNMV